MNLSTERAIVFEKNDTVHLKINSFLKEKRSDGGFIVEEVRTIEELSNIIVVYYKGFIKE